MSAITVLPATTGAAALLPPSLPPSHSAVNGGAPSPLPLGGPGTPVGTSHAVLPRRTGDASATGVTSGSSRPLSAASTAPSLRLPGTAGTAPLSAAVAEAPPGLEGRDVEAGGQGEAAAAAAMGHVAGWPASVASSASTQRRRGEQQLPAASTAPPSSHSAAYSGANATPPVVPGSGGAGAPASPAARAEAEGEGEGEGPLQRMSVRQAAQFDEQRRNMAAAYAAWNGPAERSGTPATEAPGAAAAQGQGAAEGGVAVTLVGALAQQHFQQLQQQQQQQPGGGGGGGRQLQTRSTDPRRAVQELVNCLVTDSNKVRRSGALSSVESALQLALFRLR